MFLTVSATPVINYFQPEVIASNDYSSFGAPMQERSFSLLQQSTSTISQSNYSSGVDSWLNDWGPASNTTITAVSSQLRIVASVQFGAERYNLSIPLAI